MRGKFIAAIYVLIRKKSQINDLCYHVKNLEKETEEKLTPMKQKKEKKSRNQWNYKQKL